MIPGEEPAYIDIGRYGIRHDHCIAVMDPSKSLPFRVWEDPTMTHLRSFMRDNILRVETLNPDPLVAAGLPTFIELDLEKDPKTIGGPWMDFVNPSITRTKKFHGYAYGNDVQNWFRTALCKEEIYVIRSPQGYTAKPKFGKLPEKKSGDLARTLLCETPLHFVNDRSVRNLTSVVELRNKEKPLTNWNHCKENYRANIYFDLPEAYEEERLTEYRIGPLLMRLVGPAIRCQLLKFNMTT